MDSLWLVLTGLENDFPLSDKSFFFEIDAEGSVFSFDYEETRGIDFIFSENQIAIESVEEFSFVTSKGCV
jgi:hypothetical protein